MADIFRLLSRSTSFAKGASGGSNLQKSRIPPSTSTPNPKKRKSTTTTDVIPKELDFFSMGPADPNPDNSKKLKRGTIDDSDASADELSDIGPETAQDDAGPVLESEDDIKQALWSHKLKFTILSGPIAAEEGAGGEGGEKKKKKKKKQQSVLIPPLTSFRQLRSESHGYALSKRVYENILRQGYTAPTEVQMGALPVLMKKNGVSELVRGDVDLLTCAPTGSGKTLAYVVPLLDGVLAARKSEEGEKGIKAVVIAPTKELAGQIVNEIKKLSVGTGVKGSLMKKGSHIKSDIVVSTPLQLLHAIESEEGKKEFGKVRRLVLDEADVLLDELFRDQTLGIWKALRETAGGELRTSLWSATISSSTEEIARNMMLPTDALPTLDEPSSPSPKKKSKKSKKPDSVPKQQTILRLIVGIKDTAIPTVSQTLLYTATEPGKLLALRQLFTTSLHPPALIFVQSIARATALYNEILYDLPAPGRIAVLHSALSDTAREDVMDRFRRGEVWVLITTDLLARGVDFRGVRLVVNYDIPTTVVAYIHRVGRTGRAGKEGGEAVTYYTKEDVRYVKGIANVIAVAQKMAGREVEGGVQKWLLDALPKTGRRERGELKKWGVKARSGKGEGKEGRISTKSGWERKKEDRRRGAVEGSKRRKEEGGGGSEDEAMGDVGGDEDEEFMGIDD